VLPDCCRDRDIKSFLHSHAPDLLPPVAKRYLRVLSGYGQKMIAVFSRLQ
jgi:hypothetical protein